ncbi:hypothetical protein AYO47_09285 [Planctomyces sp. SCGC AG-212-M04]|nr:hypothetical protein AYO47_09285 [Planctomyces sp. SCGC AG-212-M04]
MRGFSAARWTRGCVLATALLASALTARAADEDASPQALLPPDTYLFISCPSVVDLKARFADSAMGKLWKDRSMSGIREEVKKLVDEAAADAQREIGIPLNDLLGLPSGEVTLAASKVNNKLGAALIVDVGDNTETLEKVVKKIDDGIQGQGAKKSTETYEEIELTVFKADGNSPKELVHFTDESFVVFTSNVGLAKAIIDRWDGKHEKTFAANPVLTTILEECEESEDEYADLYYYVDPVNLAMEVMKMDPKTAGNAAMAQGFLPLLGLDKLKAIGGASTLSSEDFDSVSRTMIYVEQPLTGILSVFRMPATIEGPPKWVSKDVDQYSGFAWDVAGAYKSIDTLVMTFAPQIGGLDALLDQVASHPNNPGIHPKKDLLDQLTGIVHVMATEKEGDDPGTQRMLIAIGVKDEKKVQNVVEKVAAQVPNLKPRTFEGATIYDIEAGGDNSPALAITRGHLFIGTHPAALEAAIRGKSVAEEPLTSAEDYQAVAAHFPKPASSIGFSRPAAQIKSIWELARKGTFNETLHGFDLSKLPEFKSVEKYFAPSGSSIAPHEKGAILMNFSLPVE